METVTPAGTTFLVISILYDNTLSLIGFLGFIGLLVLYPFSLAQAWLWLEIGWAVILLASDALALDLAFSELKGASAHE